ncbi:uncharacterized protein LACBIDRAFT_314643 [Laccaria bicolor S238N-H82]|uniref:Predicted protein n=1 Tax=Laccaria bicolor (strain S238N-H82 / ATCC MYA-4686) TaxID=486041 RepID=B0DYY1_LACBS|nr:uncharacterized protein LACBIDRAFT_314643 [Laccaria bicolor S238N-H82]EDR00225.1 predicted protein [Laccaria bicolor S238N-H82]|eukprot:XP_001889134.1 predicted protein [Laccaria bicolor S238N-H82]
MLECAGLNVKHVQKMAAEWDPFLHADFICHRSQYPPNYLLPIDEVSKDDHTYLWGRAPVGEWVEQHDPFVQRGRYSMIAALALDEGIIALRVVEGSLRHDTFFKYLHANVLPLMTPFSGPHSVLLLMVLHNPW